MVFFETKRFEEALLDAGSHLTVYCKEFEGKKGSKRINKLLTEERRSQAQKLRIQVYERKEQWESIMQLFYDQFEQEQVDLEQFIMETCSTQSLKAELLKLQGLGTQIELLNRLVLVTAHHAGFSVFDQATAHSSITTQVNPRIRSTFNASRVVFIEALQNAFKIGTSGQILHFMGHGEVENDGWLLLQGTDRISFRDVRACFEYEPELITLAACSVGQFVTNLSNSYVIGYKSDVPARAALSFFQTFYAELAKDFDIRRAFGQAVLLGSPVPEPNLFYRGEECARPKPS